MAAVAAQTINFGEAEICKKSHDIITLETLKNQFPILRRLAGHEGGEGGEQDQAEMMKVMGECGEKCEGFLAFIMGVAGDMQKMEGMTDEAEQDKAAAAMLEKMCKEADTVKCAVEKCGEMVAGLLGPALCACGCPAVVTLGEMMTAPPGSRKPLFAEFCPKMDDTMKCMKNEDSCAVVMAGVDANSEALIRAGCAFEKEGCAFDPAEKTSWESCWASDFGGPEETARCDGLEAPDEQCCANNKKMMDCMGGKCFLMSVGLQKGMAGDDAKKQIDANIKRYADACPDLKDMAADVEKTMKEATAPPAAPEEGAASSGAYCVATAAPAILFGAAALTVF